MWVGRAGCVRGGGGGGEGEGGRLGRLARVCACVSEYLLDLRLHQQLCDWRQQLCYWRQCMCVREWVLPWHPLAPAALWLAAAALLLAAVYVRAWVSTTLTSACTSSFVSGGSSFVIGGSVCACVSEYYLDLRLHRQLCDWRQQQWGHWLQGQSALKIQWGRTRVT